MAIRPRGRKRSLSKKVSSFNMYMDQVYQIRAIMEATGAVKDAPVIRELLDEAWLRAGERLWESQSRKNLPGRVRLKRFTRYRPCYSS
jgi:hypothetical protein